MSVWRVFVVNCDHPEGCVSAFTGSVYEDQEQVLKAVQGAKWRVLDTACGPVHVCPHHSNSDDLL